MISQTWIIGKAIIRALFADRVTNVMRYLCNIVIVTSLIPYNENDSRKKTFTNFAILGAFANVFLQNFPTIKKFFFMDQLM